MRKINNSFSFFLMPVERKYLYPRRVIFFTCMLSLATTFGAAQSFKAGISAGLSTTQISGDQLSGFNKVGILAGGFVSTRISDTFDGSFQIIYIQKGSRKNAKPEKNDYTSYILRLSYIEVPVLLQWMYSERFWFETGPTFGVLLSEYEEDQLGELPERRPFNSFELGFAAGMNIRLVDNLIANIRFNSSIIPVRKHQSGQTYRLNAGQYNAVLSFTVNYQLTGSKSK
jgi:outer membrane protein with beta-barrel domain